MKKINDISSKELESLLGVGPTFISLIKRGKRSCPTSHALALNAAYGIPLTDLNASVYPAWIFEKV